MGQLFTQPLINSTLTEVERSLDQITKRARFKAVWKCLKDAQTLGRHNAKIKEACQLFNASPHQVLDHYHCLLRRSEVL